MSMRLMTYQAKIYEDPSDEKVWTCISAYMENCLLFIIQVDWGGSADDYSKDGEVESFVFFDLENTNKLARSFQARREEVFVKKIAEYFGRYKRSAKHEICKYCDKRGITYMTHVHY